MAHKPVSPTTYAAVYVALVGFTALTVALSAYAHLGRAEVVAALGIATVKTVLVGLFFMHLIHSGRLIWLIIAAGVLFLAVLIGLTMGDYLTRTWVPVRGVPAAWFLGSDV
jgi:cytochrome c oxidase subunit 4